MLTLPAADVEAASHHSEAVEYGDGDVIVLQGDPADHVYLLVAGTARVETGDGVVLGTMGPGTLIGELSILAGGERTATVTAVGSVSARRFERDEFVRFLDSDSERSRLVSEEVNRRLDEHHIAAFARRLLGTDVDIPFDDFRQHLTWRWIRAGEALYRRGDPAEAGYLVVSGRLRVLAPTDDGDDGVIGEIGRDEFVGEAGLFERRPRQVTVVAIRDSLVAEVTRQAATDLLGRHPGVLGPLLLNVVRRARQGPTAQPRRTLALCVAADMDQRVFATRLADEMAHHGTCAHVWSGLIDARLSQPGVTHSTPENPGFARMDQMLHELELSHDHVVFEVDREWSPWSERTARQADRLVACITPAPTDSEYHTVDRFFASGSDHAQRVVVVMHPPGTERPVGTAELVQRWKVDRIHHMVSGSNGGMARLGRLLSGRAYGLALGGGGARGFAHIGAYRAMSELGIPIDLVGGTSMGGAMGVGIAMDLTADVRERFVDELFKDLLDYTLPIVSLIKGERITAAIAKALGDWDFEDLWLPYFCVSTNLTQSREVVHDRGSLVTPVRASVSIPGVMPPVAWGEDLLVDGGVLNNLPADIVKQRVEGSTVIAVDVVPPSGPKARRDIALSVSGWDALRAKAGKGKAYPGLTALLMRTMIAGATRDRTELLARGDIDLYLDLDLRGVSMLDFDNAKPVIQAGYEAAMPRLETWLAERAARGEG